MQRSARLAVMLHTLNLSQALDIQVSLNSIYCRADDPPASFRVLCSCIILKTDYPFFFAATACDSVTIYAVVEHIEREAQPIRIYRVPHHIHRVVVP